MKYSNKLSPYIEEAYSFFSYLIDKHLSVCDCDNCITPAEIDDLCPIPFRSSHFNKLAPM
ncbi:hypothetical protein [Capnocytophaga sp. oral taxon 326]|uniref:hypothetical protein n=1 Tax=Capnocytophaga sp. oral taxon 326 TaxID=712212 RepID=UPI0002A285F0|nr:hypothetical protein [Capnocytophaga sp. oral taxon 326]EKY21179.1 hypothetical protein HMPREF9073_00461 [Capnocytophaga sp. oral taxon 326 str. F0382]